MIREEAKKTHKASFFYAEVTNITPLKLAFSGFVFISEQIRLTSVADALIKSNSLKIGDTVLIKINYDDDNSIHSILVVDRVVK